MASFTPSDDGPSPGDPAGISFDAPPAPGDYAGAVTWIASVRDLEERPGEGLRERKKRLMRQEISDAATWMFCERGYDNVRVADIAAAVGVSEKTVFNYFPTKESLVLDKEDDLTAALVGALRDREPGSSPTQAVVAVMKEQWLEFSTVPPEALWMVQAVGDLLRDTPALRAAEQAMTNRMTDGVVAALAENAQLDPLDPEPQIVAQALMGLWHVVRVSADRHLGDGLVGAELSAALDADIARASRLLETGLWSFNLFAQGKRTQRASQDAAKAMEDARAQVQKAMREAREVWRSARQLHAEVTREQRREQQAASRERWGRGGRGGRGGGGPRGGGPRGGGPGRG